MSYFAVVYSVCADLGRILNDKRASLNPAGRLREQPPLATTEWWEAIQAGRIPTRIRFGSVTRIEPYATQAFPMIYFTETDGREGRCEMFGPEDAYKPGTGIAIMEWREMLHPMASEISPRTSHPAWFVFEIWIARDNQEDLLGT